jgi:hypothetical protein
MEVIGFLILAEDTDFQRDFETASNFETIYVPAGEYPVFPCSHIRGMVRADLPGIKTRSYFVNRLFQSSNIRDENPNTPDVYKWSIYGFQFEKMVQEGKARFISGKGEK